MMFGWRNSDSAFHLLKVYIPCIWSYRYKALLIHEMELGLCSQGFHNLLRNIMALNYVAVSYVVFKYRQCSRGICTEIYYGTFIFHLVFDSLYLR